VSTIGNLSIGLRADTTALNRDVVEAAQKVSTAFAAAKATIAPELVIPDVALDGVAAPQVDAPEVDATTIQNTLALMSRQSAEFGANLTRGFALVTPSIQRIANELRAVGQAARRSNIEAWRTEHAQRVVNATADWQKKLVAVEGVALKIRSHYERLKNLAGSAGALFGRAQQYRADAIEGGILSRAIRAPGKALARGAGSVGQGVAQGAAEATGGSGGVLAGFAMGGIAGGVAVAVARTVDWAKANAAVMRAYETLKAKVVPWLDALRAAVEPVLTALKALGMAAVETFKGMFQRSTEESERGVKSLAQRVLDWVTATVDGGNVVVNAFRAVGRGVAWVVDQFGALKGVWLAAQSLASSAIASMLRGLDWLGRQLVQLLNLIPGVSIALGESLGQVADAMDTSAAEAMQRAGEAWNAPSTRAKVDQFFDHVADRARELAGDIARPVEDTSWLQSLADAWNQTLGEMGKTAEKLWDQLLSPTDKLAEKFNELDRLRDAGLLSEGDATKLKSKAAGEFLGDAATKNPAALEAGSKEARTTLLQWQNAQRDPLRELPNLSRQQLDVANKHTAFLSRIAGAIADGQADVTSYAMGS
jgi:hypothetical protein